MSNCKDCKHWGSAAFQYPSGCVQRPCAAMQMGDARAYQGKQAPERLAVVQEAYGNTETSVYTSPEFGCVFFEAALRDEEAAPETERNA